MRRRHVLRTTICLCFLVGNLPETPLRAESRSDAWLRFPRLDAPAAQMYETLPARLVVLGQSAILDTAQKELTGGLKQMLEKTLRAQPDLPQEKRFILGTLKEVQAAVPEIRAKREIADDAFWQIKTQEHGFSAFLSRIARNESLSTLDDLQEPFAPIRWVDQWDNLDGHIERGYAGRSIFFDNGAVRDDLTAINDYARLLASIGVNGCNINNVNA